MQVEDLSFSVEHYGVYDTVDLHIGFRVHAHMYFLSNRKPSILLHEDGRDVAMSETIGLAGVNAFKAHKFSVLGQAMNYAARQLGNSRLIRHDINPLAIKKLRQLITMHQHSAFVFMNGVYSNFDANFETMMNFIAKIADRTDA